VRTATLILAGALLTTTRARAEEARVAPREPPPEYVVPELPEPTPLPRRGFQAALRPGIAFPLGGLSGSRSMSDVAGAQIPLLLDVGFKVSPHVFLGAYGSFGLGFVTSAFEEVQCRARDCGARSVHVGAQVQYHASPASEVNPWIGYGIGYEWLWTTGIAGTSYRGPEYARFMLGVDLRLSRSIGLGPVADLTLAQYTDASAEPDVAGGTAGARGGASVDLSDKALHEWVTLGFRVVAYP